MRREDEQLGGLRTLGDALERAASDEVAARGRRRRRARRLAVAVVASLLVAGGVATATGIISIGEPASDPPGRPESVRPGTGDLPAPSVYAADEEAGGTWGVRTFTSRGGLLCAQAGWVRGASLGLVEDGRFRPYARTNTGGTCQDGSAAFAANTLQTDEPVRRTLVYGRAAPRIDGIVLTHAGETRTIRPGPDGAYLVVLDGHVPFEALTLRPAG